MSQEMPIAAGPGTVVDDYDAICRVLKLSSEGEATGDVSKMREAWHAGGWMHASMASGRYDEPVTTWIPQRGSRPADGGDYRWRVVSVQQTGDAAAAVVAEDGYRGVCFINYLLLARFDGSWKIVSCSSQQLGG